MLLEGSEDSTEGKECFGLVGKGHFSCIQSRAFKGMDFTHKGRLAMTVP